MSSWFATVLERISTIPGAVVSITAAAASSQEDSIPSTSIALSLVERAQMRAAAGRVLRRQKVQLGVRFRQAQPDRHRWLERLDQHPSLAPPRLRTQA